jgi:hypothetical protein
MPQQSSSICVKLFNIDSKTGDAIEIIARDVSAFLPTYCTSSIHEILQRIQSFSLLYKLEKELTEAKDEKLFCLHSVLQVLSQRQLLQLATAPDNFAAVLSPIAPPFHLSFAEIGDHVKYRLSRFAYIHRNLQDNLVLETPLGLARIELNGDSTAACLFHLSHGITLSN